jgi:uncharacterized protein
MIWSLVSAVFVTSLLGSTHCAGMCGAFVAFAIVGERQSLARKAMVHAMYNAGRLLTYCSLGAAAGSAGSVLDAGGAIVGVQRVAVALAGVCMILFAMISLLRHLGVRVPRVGLPDGLNRLAIALHRRIARWPDSARAAATGLLTTLLPCGWLYAFVVVAGGTAHPLLGALVMTIFWLGTLPVLVALGAGLSTLSGPLRARLPVASMIVLLVVGVLSVVGRLALPADALQHATSLRGTMPNTTTTALDTINAMHAQERPTCHGN